MVVAAYLAGLITTPAAVLGVVAGMRWWRALRRAQSVSEPLALTLLPPPPPPDPQEAPVLSRISLRNVPGRRRAVRGRRPR